MPGMADEGSQPHCLAVPASARALQSQPAVSILLKSQAFSPSDQELAWQQAQLLWDPDQWQFGLLASGGRRGQPHEVFNALDLVLGKHHWHHTQGDQLLDLRCCAGMAEVCWQLGQGELVKGPLQPAWLGLVAPLAVTEALPILQHLSLG